MVFIFSSQLVIPTRVTCCSGIKLLYRYLSRSSRKTGDVQRQGQLFLSIVSFQFYSSWKYLFPMDLWGTGTGCTGTLCWICLGVSIPEDSQPWAAWSDPALSRLLQGPPELLSSLSCPWHYGMLVHFTFAYCSIPTFFLISDHSPVGKDEFRVENIFSAARIVCIRKEKSVWNM